jgi:hypothetical protein
MEFIVGEGKFFCHNCKQYSVSRYMPANMLYPPMGSTAYPPSRKFLNLPSYGMKQVMAIAIVLIITISLAVVGVYIISPGHDHEPYTPRGHMTINGNSTTYYTAMVQTMDSRGLDVEKAEYFLVSTIGSTVAHGTVANIIGRNIEESWVNLSFLDTDQDNRISANDRFHLKGTGNGGICGSGYAFTIRFTETDEIVMKQTTP